MTSPAAIQHLYDRLKAEGYPGAEFGGIYANKPGYHNARKNLPGSDYSVQQPDDRAGSADNASALDITLRNPADMERLTRRLIALADGHDPAISVLREFYGTVDGATVTGRDIPTGAHISSDDSHLWHAHISVHRKWAGDKPALDRLASAILNTEPDTTTESETPLMFIVTKANGAAYLLWGDNLMYAIENGDDMTALKNLKDTVPRGVPYSGVVSDDLFARMTKGRTKK